MSASARFDLKLDKDDKDLFSQAATLMGTPMAGFVRTAAKEKARSVIDQESRLILSMRDFEIFNDAIENDFQKSGLGKIILGCAVDRCLRARCEVAAYALIVDALGESAKAYYLHFGFIPFADRPLSLYLPLSKK